MDHGTNGFLAGLFSGIALASARGPWTLEGIFAPAGYGAAAVALPILFVNAPGPTSHRVDGLLNHEPPDRRNASAIVLTLALLVATATPSLADSFCNDTFTKYSAIAKQLNPAFGLSPADAQRDRIYIQTLNEIVSAPPDATALRVEHDCDSDTVFEYDLANTLHSVLLLTVTGTLPETKGLMSDSDHSWALRDLVNIEGFVDAKPGLDAQRFRMLVEAVRSSFIRDHLPVTTANQFNLLTRWIAPGAQLPEFKPQSP